MWCHCVNSEKLTHFSSPLEVCKLGKKHIPLPFLCHSAVTKCCSGIYLPVVWQPDFSKLSHMHSLILSSSLVIRWPWYFWFRNSGYDLDFEIFPLDVHSFPSSSPSPSVVSYILQDVCLFLLTANEFTGAFLSVSSAFWPNHAWEECSSAVQAPSVCCTLSCQQWTRRQCPIHLDVAEHESERVSQV